jgi:hypothetical protein
MKKIRMDISIEWNIGRKKSENAKQIRNKSIKINTFDSITSMRVSNSGLTS